MEIVVWNGKALEKVAGCGCCTWTDDEKVNEEVSLPDNAKGVVVHYRRDGHTPIPSASCFGFGRDELAAPAPVAGFYADRSGFNACQYPQIETTGDYLVALATDSLVSLESFKVVATDGDLRVRETGYEWGDQAAEDYILTKTVQGKETVLARNSGCGDRAPYLLAKWAEEFRAGRAWTSHPMSDRVAAQQAEENEIYAAVDAADSKILAHMRASYEAGMNPLPTLRKQKGGKWLFQDGDGFKTVPNLIAIYKRGDGADWQGWKVCHCSK